MHSFSSCCNILLLLSAALSSHFELCLAADNLNGSSLHRNNWALIVATSRYWFNYRHQSNALGIYRVVRRLGIPDSQIVLMLGDESACDGRNAWKASIMASTAAEAYGVYDDNIEVDYRNAQVSTASILRVLTGRHPLGTAASQRLDTDEHSNVLVYLTGHGGDTFLKLHDKNELQSGDLADAFQMMHSQKRFREVLFIADTCQATTLCADIGTPNVIAVGSSQKAQSSYSYTHSVELGVTIVDRFTHFIVRFFETEATGRSSLPQLMHTLDFGKLKAHASADYSRLRRDPNQVKLTDFFAANSDVTLTDATVDIAQNHSAKTKMHRRDELLMSADTLRVFALRSKEQMDKSFLPSLCDSIDSFSLSYLSLKTLTSTPYFVALFVGGLSMPLVASALF